MVSQGSIGIGQLMLAPPVPPSGDDAGTQAPFWQALPDGHMRPQAPQLLGSMLRLVHIGLPLVGSAHEVGAPGEHVGGGGGRAHWPLEQVWPAPHTMPHAPQFAGSERRLVHIGAPFVPGHAATPG